MPHRLNSYLTTNQELLVLANKAKQLKALQHDFESMIPPALKAHSQVLQLHEQTLIIAAHNGAIAAKLRQMTTELISLFQERGCEVTGIQIRVQVRVPLHFAPSKPRKLGEAGRNALEKLQSGLADSPLKAVLGRLIKRP